MLSVLAAGTLRAAGEVSAIYHPCAEDSGGVGSCTANEIDIADATLIELDLPPSVKTCTAGETLPVKAIIAEYGLNTGVRYDPLLWVGQRGNDPRDPEPGGEVSGSCFVTSAPYTEGLIFGVEEGEAADSCLDISNPEVASVTLPYPIPDFTIECQDADSDGKADVHVLITWVQNTNLLCGDKEGEMFGTGAPPKCNYSLITLDLDYQEASLTIVKQIISNDGGLATLGDFDVAVDGIEVPWEDASSTTGGSEQMASEAGTYTLSEADVEGYTEGTWSCVDADQNDVPVTNGGLFSGADVTVGEGQEVTCSIANSDDAPALTVVKSVINDDGGEAQPGDFTLRLDGGIYVNEPLTSGDSPAVMANTVYTLSEDPPGPGYETLGVSCFDEGAEAGVPHPVTLAPGQVVTCTMTNDDLPPGTPVLTLLKSVTNDNGGDAEPGDFTLLLTGGVYEDEPFGSGATPPVVAGTVYTLSEEAYFGYDNLGVTCFDETAGEVVPHPVTLSEGQVVSCTIANDDIAPDLRIVKEVVNDDGGEAEAGDWTMVVTATNPSDNGFPGEEAPGTLITIDAGSFSVDETGGPDGYFKTRSADCDGSLGVGESAVCVITDDDIQPSLTIAKAILFNDEGPATLGDFDVRVDGVAVPWADPGSTSGGMEVAATAAGTYTLSEMDLDDYDEGAWSCSDADGDVPVSNGGLFSGADVIVLPGQDVTCGITNVYLTEPPGQSLTVEKIIVSDQGGSAVLGDFDVSVGGDEVAWANPSSTTGGIQLAAIEAGTYTLSEGDVDGYVPGTWSCSDPDGPVPVTNGGAYDGADVTVASEQHVTCSITNDDMVLPPSEQSLTVTKFINSDHGGAATVEDFDIRVNGVPVNWGHPESPTGDSAVVADLPGTYRLSEADFEDYEEGRWACSDDEGEVPVSDEGRFSGADVVVEPYQHVRCSITNNDVFVPVPGLVVVKTIRSNYGGTATLADFDVSVNGTEVNWENPDSVEGGSRFVSGKPGTYTLSEADVEGWMEGRWSCRDDRHLNVPVSNDGHFSGADVTVAPERQVTCSIANNDEPPRPDLSVTKRTEPEIGECGVIVGQPLDFQIVASNAGPGLAEGVILDDHWSWQLKLVRAPDRVECSGPEDRRIRCKLGNMEAGASNEVSLGFMVGGNPGEQACNFAAVSTYPADPGDAADNEAEVCIDLVGRLALASDCSELATAVVGAPYAVSIDIAGGEAPYDAEFLGLPEGFAGTVAGNQVRIEGCASEPGASEFTITVADRLGCQDTLENPAVCSLVIVENPDCPMGELKPSAIPPAGAPTPDDDALPDESVQKIVVDADRNRYLVGFAYREHEYATDPNGPYIDKARNYDIRVVKYDDTGEPLWDKTYDTGNDDYGYAIALDPDEEQPGLYVGGSALVETGPHAWREAVLLEIDPSTGCPADPHFQSAGQGTTSAWYDIGTDGARLYAVGERQRNEKLAGEFGALVSVFHRSEFGGSVEPCQGDHHIIGYPPPAGGDPALVRNMVREGGLIPTVAYSVKVPDPECAACQVLVGGRSEAGGWVDNLASDGSGLVPWLDQGMLGDISVQDMAVQGDRVIVVGSSSANEMRALAFGRGGSALWAPKALGQGRLRAVATDAYGAVYVVGRSDDDSSGLIFKFDEAGTEIDRDRLLIGSGLSFTDVAIFRPGNGVIAALSEESQFDYLWQQVEFECDPSADACPPESE